MRKKKAIIFILLISLLLSFGVGCDLLSLDDEDKEDEFKNKTNFGQKSVRIVEDFYSNIVKGNLEDLDKDLANQVLFSRKGEFLGINYNYTQTLDREGVIDEYSVLDGYSIDYNLDIKIVSYVDGDRPFVQATVTLELFDEDTWDDIDESYNIWFYFEFQSDNWRIIEIDYNHK